MSTPEEVRASTYEKEAENIKQELVKFERYVRWQTAYYLGMANAIRTGTEDAYQKEYLRKAGIVHVDTSKAFQQDV